MDQEPAYSETRREPSREGHRKPHGDEARWMTFQELAAVRGTSKRAAVTLVRRHGWRRQRDNQNRVIALVPLTWAITETAGEAREEAHSEAHNGPVGQSHTAAFETALTAIEAAHAGEIAALREQVDTSERARTAAQALADQALAAVADLTARMDAAVSIADRTTSMAADVVARADRADAVLTAERGRADALRDRIEALQGQLAAAEAEGTESDVEAAELTAQLKQARADAQVAAQDAEALRQVDAERRARGLVARLRAAWRGE
jgi:hypothetical protein